MTLGENTDRGGGDERSEAGDIGPFEPVIGLEVHVQLRTRTKLFCRCPNRFGAPPNSLVCEICLGYPGALPVPEGEAPRQALRLALALGADIAEESTFDRKSYFYPDLPKGYQVTQHRHPLATGGRLPLSRLGGDVAIAGLHLEEDSGKLLHRLPDEMPGETPGAGAPGGESFVDFNRAGVPLVELVTEPVLRRPEEAEDFLRSLHRLVRHLGVSDGRLEEGSLRCDANVSLSPAGSPALGERVELKNLSSFRHVRRALDFEIERQGEVLTRGEEVRGETRSFDERSGRTRRLRDKETGRDYRYVPEPDLPPLRISKRLLDELEAQLPELPWLRQRRFEEDLGLEPAAALLLTGDPALADYADQAARNRSGDVAPRSVLNWLRTEVLRLAAEDADLVDFEDLEAALSPRRLAALVAMVEAGELSSSAGKAVLEALWRRDAEPAEIARELDLLQVGDPRRLAEWIDAVLAEEAEQVADYRAGKSALLGFFVGRVMARSGGRADPRAARRGLERALDTGDAGNAGKTRAAAAAEPVEAGG